MVLCANTCNSTNVTNIKSTTESLTSVPEEFFAYKAGVFIYSYFTVPIAVLGMERKLSNIQVNTYLIDILGSHYHAKKYVVWRR